jgi:inorganic pyrophosphatase
MPWVCSPFFKDDEAGMLNLMEVVAGFGLGGSCIAMFGRVGGGIYTKAADVGADLAGKVVQDLPEDDVHNPGTIADNVGDNVGDVAGMGSDLFGSFGEASVAALLVGASSAGIYAAGWGALMYPLVVSGAGIIACIVTNYFATDFFPVREENDIEKVLKTQLLVSSLLMTPVVYYLSITLLPAATCGECVGGFVVGSVCSSPLKAALCVIFGLWGGCAIGFITEFFTSFSYKPVQDVADSCRTGAATNIIYGLALGYKSVILPVFILSGIVFGAHTIAGFYGIALAALGMLSNLATTLSIDVYGPVCDNAGGIAEMCELHPSVREKTDALDAAGNTTAAIGKGFAIGSACLVGLALFGAFVTRLNDAGAAQAVDLLDPITFAGLLVGSMLPYWFSAMTMKSVGLAANAMVSAAAALPLIALHACKRSPQRPRAQRDGDGHSFLWIAALIRCSRSSASSTSTRTCSSRTILTVLTTTSASPSRRRPPSRRWCRPLSSSCSRPSSAVSSSARVASPACSRAASPRVSRWRSRRPTRAALGTTRRSTSPRAR